MSKKLLIVMVGLPRSGKTTWVWKNVRRLGAAVVNPDSIRRAMHGQRFAKEAEQFVWAVAQAMVRALFLAGHEVVIVDATNTTRKRRDDWQTTDWNVVFKVIDPPMETCIERARAHKDETIVPVIERMAKAFEWLGPDEDEYSEEAE